MASKAALDKQLKALDAAATHAQSGSLVSKGRGGPESAGHRHDTQLAALDAISAPRAKPKARSLTLKQAITPDADERATKKTAGLALPLGVHIAPLPALRTIAHAARAVAEETVTHPLNARSKAAGTVKDIVKGAAGAAIGLPTYAVKYEADQLLHPTGAHKVDSPAAIGARMVGRQAKALSEKYGASYEGKPGAFKGLKKAVHAEGPLPTALDLATVAAPLSSGLGKAARTLADAEVGGKGVAAVARATRERPTLKVNAARPGVEQTARPSVVGAAGTSATDVARRLAQRAAKRRHAKTGRPLRADRALLAPGEVAPLTRIGANRKLRLSAATNQTRRTQAANLRIEATVTGTKGETLRNVRASVAPELHPILNTMQELGIRDSAGARAILPHRIAQIERDRDAALAAFRKSETGRKVGDAGEHGKRDSKAELRAAAADADGQLHELKAMLAHPEVFDHAELRAAADAEARLSRKAGGPREGLSADRAALGRAENLGHTLDVKPAAKLNAEAKAAHAAEIDAAKADLESAAAERAATRATADRVLSGAREDLAKAKGRGEILHRNVTGKNTVVGGRYAGGGHGVREAQGALDRATAAVESRIAASHENVLAARSAVAEARKAPLKKIKETPAEYEARVHAAAKELHPNLVAPEYIPAGFEREGFAPTNAVTNGQANPLSKTRHGTLYRLGRSEADYKQIERDMIGKLAKGAAHEYESKLIHEQGKVFPNASAFNAWAEKNGLNADPDLGPVTISMFKPTNGVLRKDLAPVARGKKGRPVAGADRGDYHATDAVVAFPKAITDELEALHQMETRVQGPISKALRGAAHYSQAVLLGGSLSWFQFQRVNDLLASAVGGSLMHTRALNRALKGLDEEDRHLVHILSGGSVSSAALKPNAMQEVGRLRQLLESNPSYSAALASDKPLTRLLAEQAGKNPLTGLLRADQAITKGFRERQFIHNLAKFERDNNPRVSAIDKGFAPLADAFKTADMEQVSRLLRDPASRTLVEDAAQQLYKVHGDWHNFTAAERKLGATAAFYGFLRYATRMAFFTLPLGHPHMTLLLSQLGQMSANDARAIIGPDQPWALGAIYNHDGTVAADLSRANPVAAPLFNLNKPEDLLGLSTPLASIVASYVTGTNIGLSDSAAGFIRQFTVKGDPSDHSIGGFTSPERLRIALRSVLNLMAPAREWDKFDSTAQSDDSLPWSRRHLTAPESPAAQLLIDEKNRTAESGVSGLVHREFPLLAPGSKKNLKTQGASIAAGKLKSKNAAEMKAAKREGALTPQGHMDAELNKLDAQAQQATPADAKLDELDRQLKLLEARSGG